MDDKKLVCKADYEAAKARGNSNIILLSFEKYSMTWGQYN